MPNRDARLESPARAVAASSSSLASACAAFLASIASGSPPPRDALLAAAHALFAAHAETASHLNDLRTVIDSIPAPTLVVSTTPPSPVAPPPPPALPPPAAAVSAAAATASTTPPLPSAAVIAAAVSSALADATLRAAVSFSGTIARALETEDRLLGLTPPDNAFITAQLLVACLSALPPAPSAAAFDALVAEHAPSARVREAAVRVSEACTAALTAARASDGADDARAPLSTRVLSAFASSFAARLAQLPEPTPGAPPPLVQLRAEALAAVIPPIFEAAAAGVAVTTALSSPDPTPEAVPEPVLIIKVMKKGDRFMKANKPRILVLQADHWLTYYTEEAAQGSTPRGAILVSSFALSEPLRMVTTGRTSGGAELAWELSFESNDTRSALAHALSQQARATRLLAARGVDISSAPPHSLRLLHFLLADADALLPQLWATTIWPLSMRLQARELSTAGLSLTMHAEASSARAAASLRELAVDSAPASDRRRSAESLVARVFDLLISLPSATVLSPDASEAALTAPTSALDAALRECVRVCDIQEAAAARATAIARERLAAAVAVHTPPSFDAFLSAAPDSVTGVQARTDAEAHVVATAQALRESSAPEWLIAQCVSDERRTIGALCDTCDALAALATGVVNRARGVNNELKDLLTDASPPSQRRARSKVAIADGVKAVATAVARAQRPNVLAAATAAYEARVSVVAAELDATLSTQEARNAAVVADVQARVQTLLAATACLLQEGGQGKTTAARARACAVEFTAAADALEEEMRAESAQVPSYAAAELVASAVSGLRGRRDAMEACAGGREALERAVHATITRVSDTLGALTAADEREVDGRRKEGEAVRAAGTEEVSSVARGAGIEGDALEVALAALEGGTRSSVEALDAQLSTEAQLAASMGEAVSAAVSTHERTLADAVRALAAVEGEDDAAAASAALTDAAATARMWVTSDGLNALLVPPCPRHARAMLKASASQRIELAAAAASSAVASRAAFHSAVSGAATTLVSVLDALANDVRPVAVRASARATALDGAEAALTRAAGGISNALVTAARTRIAQAAAGSLETLDASLAAATSIEAIQNAAAARLAACGPDWSAKIAYGEELAGVAAAWALPDACACVTDKNIRSRIEGVCRESLARVVSSTKKHASDHAAWAASQVQPQQTQQGQGVLTPMPPQQMQMSPQQQQMQQQGGGMPYPSQHMGSPTQGYQHAPAYQQQALSTPQPRFMTGGQPPQMQHMQPPPPPPMPPPGGQWAPAPQGGGQQQWAPAPQLPTQQQWAPTR